MSSDGFMPNGKVKSPASRFNFTRCDVEQRLAAPAKGTRVGPAIVDSKDKKLFGKAEIGPEFRVSRPAMKTFRGARAATELLLILPAALFMAAPFLNMFSPSDTNRRNRLAV